VRGSSELTATGRHLHASLPCTSSPCMIILLPPIAEPALASALPRRRSLRDRPSQGTAVRDLVALRVGLSRSATPHFRPRTSEPRASLARIALLLTRLKTPCMPLLTLDRKRTPVLVQRLGSVPLAAQHLPTPPTPARHRAHARASRSAYAHCPAPVLQPPRALTPHAAYATAARAYCRSLSCRTQHLPRHHSLGAARALPPVPVTPVRLHTSTSRSARSSARPLCLLPRAARAQPASPSARARACWLAPARACAAWARSPPLCACCASPPGASAASASARWPRRAAAEPLRLRRPRASAC
jgi:hypothetical protein